MSLHHIIMYVISSYFSCESLVHRHGPVSEFQDGIPVQLLLPRERGEKGKKGGERE